MAPLNVLFDALDMGSICSTVCHRHLSVLQRRRTLQLGAVGRPARSSGRPPGRPVSDHGHSFPSPPPRLSWPSLRDVGLERRNWSRSLLGIDRNGYCHRSCDDSDGRSGTGKKIWTGVSRLPKQSRRYAAKIEIVTLIQVFPPESLVGGSYEPHRSFFCPTQDYQHLVGLGGRRRIGRWYREHLLFFS